MNQYLPGDPRVTNGALGTPNVRSEVDLADPNLKMPQVLRFNLGVDQQLPFDFVGTAEFIYGKSINDMCYKLLNLNPIIGYVPQLGSGLDGRPIYGGTNSGSGNFNDIMYLYNTSDGYQYNLVFQVQRNVSRGLSINAGYTYGRAVDRNSVTSSQAQSQMRYMAVASDRIIRHCNIRLGSEGQNLFKRYLYLGFLQTRADNSNVILQWPKREPRSHLWPAEKGLPMTESKDLNGDGLDGKRFILHPEKQQRNSDRYNFEAASLFLLQKSVQHTTTSKHSFRTTTT